MSSSRTLNISGSTAPVVDPEYRYKMPPVVCSPPSRGKTMVDNMLEIAAALRRSPEELTKFFSCELGAQATYNIQQQTTTIRGAHASTELQRLVHDYIENFVLCPTCGLPETTYRVKSGVVRHKCAACGSRAALTDGDHKLCRFIVAQYKKIKQGKATESSSWTASKASTGGLGQKSTADKKHRGRKEDISRKDEETRRTKKEDRTENVGAGKKHERSMTKTLKKKDTADVRGERGHQPRTVAAEEANAAEKPATLDDNHALEEEEEDSGEDEFDQDDGILAVWRGRWAVVPGESKRETRLRSRVYMTDETLVKMDGIRLYLKHNPNATPLDVLEMVDAGRRAAKANDTTNYYPLHVHLLVRSTLSMETIVQATAISRYAPILQQITDGGGGDSGGGTAAKLLQRHLIGAFEVVCRERPKSFALAMLQLYEHDVLDEETVLEWYADRHGRTIFTTNEVTDFAREALYMATEPFVMWLREAEEEEEEGGVEGVKQCERRDW